MHFDATTGDVFLDVFEGAPVRELKAGEVLINAGANADHVLNWKLKVNRCVNSGLVLLCPIGVEW